MDSSRRHPQPTSFFHLGDAERDEKRNISAPPFSFRQRLESNPEISFGLGSLDGALRQGRRRKEDHLDGDRDFLVHVILLLMSQFHGLFTDLIRQKLAFFRRLRQVEGPSGNRIVAAVRRSVPDQMRY